MQFRTDMADERHNLYRKANNIEDKIDGVDAEYEELENMKITRVKIFNEKGEEALGKKKGDYISIDLKKITSLEDDEKDKILNVISNELKKILDKKVENEADILVVGLGNVDFVADALGTKVINNIEVTRHIKKFYPEYLKKGTRSISAIAPGVMGKTGIEVFEIVQGLVNSIKPKALIVIDSLASRSIERISKSIQISDTGIVPGSGVGNARLGINEENLGIPVITIGVPTAVETAVIVNESLKLVKEKMGEKNSSQEYEQEIDSYEQIKDILNPQNYNLIVTPKEIDELVETLSLLVSEGINLAL